MVNNIISDVKSIKSVAYIRPIKKFNFNIYTIFIFMQILLPLHLSKQIVSLTKIC
jgi:hypothetical protein